MITINALTIKTMRLTTEFFLAGLLPALRGELIVPGMPVLERKLRLSFFEFMEILLRYFIITLSIIYNPM
jgi:hypothetical protein